MFWFIPQPALELLKYPYSYFATSIEFREELTLQQYPWFRSKRPTFALHSYRNHVNLLATKLRSQTNAISHQKFQASNCSFHSSYDCIDSSSLKARKIMPRGLYLLYLFCLFVFTVSALLTTRAQHKHFPKQRYFPNNSKALYFSKQSQARSQQSDMPEKDSSDLENKD